MRLNNATRLLFCVNPLMKRVLRDISSFHDRRPVGRGSTRNDHESQEFTKGFTIIIPEIVDYEVRREFLRSKKTQGLGRLNALKAILTYAPITTSVMLKAAENWAIARKAGRQSAADSSLDADMILAAQASEWTRDNEAVVIATTNVRHLRLFAPASIWSEIS